jgi:hypothetical protein
LVRGYQLVNKHMPAAKGAAPQARKAYVRPNLVKGPALAQATALVPNSGTQDGSSIG